MPEATLVFFLFQANPNKETESKSWKRNNMQNQIVKNPPKQKRTKLGNTDNAQRLKSTLKYGVYK